MNGISATYAVFSGFFYQPIKQFLEAGKVLDFREEEIMIKKFEDDRKKIQPIYNSKGKLIEYKDYLGRHLDFIY